MNAVDVTQYNSDNLEPVKLLERGNILLFPKQPFDISEEDRATLLNTGQADGNFHKNISYKPASHRISGLGTAIPGEEDRVRTALSNYSQNAIALLEKVLPPYRDSWKIDYASFRSIEEEGRDLPWKKRNDLLHTDAFPTRPTNGGLILRIFTNINPTKDRVWITGDPFQSVAEQYAKEAGLTQIPAQSNGLKRTAKRALRALKVPIVDRSPYDAFMLGFHDFLKRNQTYQETTPKYRFSFPPNSTWIVFTDVVPHSVLSGRFALEQTMIIDRGSLLQPACAPASILERIAGRPLTD